MAEPTTEEPKKEAPPTKPAPPPPPPEDLAKAAQENVAKQKTARDLLRPVHYTATFINGTLNDTVEYGLRYGRLGTKMGIALGILAGIASVSLMPFVMCAGAGLLGGLAIGAARGIGAGGMNAVNRQRRVDRYGDDLEDRAKIQQAAKAGQRSRSNLAEKRARYNELTVPQEFARNDEFARDYEKYWKSHDTKSSWVDRVSASTNYDKGLGY